MYGRTLANRIGIVCKASARCHGMFAESASSMAHPPQVGMMPGAAAALPGDRWTQRQGQRQRQQRCGLSSQAAQKEKVEGGGSESTSKVRRTPEEQEKVAAHKAAAQEYKAKMTALRKEIQDETKEKRHTEAVSAALERRSIAKRQAAARVERQRVAAINIALNEKKQAKLKENYEAGFRESARIFYEREERKKNIHAILLEELEAESGHWIATPEDVESKITDDLWATPGNNSAGGQITMPDEHLWRFSADIGLYNQEEEPSERNFFLRSKMHSRMEEMRTAEAYVRERRTRWDNDTRGLLKEADRLLRKRRPAPPGYLDRMETSRTDQPWKTRDGDFGEGKGGGGGGRRRGGGQQA